MTGSETTITLLMLPIMLLLPPAMELPLTVCQLALGLLSTFTLTVGEGALGMVHKHQPLVPEASGSTETLVHSAMGFHVGTPSVE